MRQGMGPALLATAGLMLTACSGGDKELETVAPPPPAPTQNTETPPPSSDRGSWREVATDHDRGRIRNWYDAWKTALASANSGGNAEKVKQQGVLLDPEAALPNPHLPPGNYKCRTFKLGSRSGTGGLTYIDYPWFSCRVSAEQNIFSLTKLTGSQRATGLIFEDNDRRQIFLGTMVLGDESGPRNYGTDKARDMAGIVERIGSQRWRVVFPYPAYESQLDVMEIVP